MPLTFHVFWLRAGVRISALQAEEKGWAIFDVDGSPYVQALDELGMIDDSEAIQRARAAGLTVADDGLVMSPTWSPASITNLEPGLWRPSMPEAAETEGNLGEQDANHWP